VSATGRPPKYDPHLHPQLAEAWATAGKIDVEIAEKLGICEDTFYAWRQKYPTFSEAIKRGKATPDDKVKQALFHRAIGYSHEHEEIFCHMGQVTRVATVKHYPPDTAACFIWLKNRLPNEWRDKVELSVKDELPTPAEIRARAEFLLGRLEVLRRQVMLCPGSRP
jgi:transposase-like protein